MPRGHSSDTTGRDGARRRRIGVWLPAVVAFTLTLPASFGLAAGVSTAATGASVQRGGGPTATAKPDDPRLDSRLIGLADAFADDGVEGARAYARRHRILLTGDGRARVLVHANAASDFRSGVAVESTLQADEAVWAALEPAIRRHVEALGGRATRRMRDLVAADVPLAALRQMVGPREIAWVQPSPMPVPMQVRSQGVEKVGALALQRSSVSYRPAGAGVRVGVLDLGFRGYQSLLGSELPSSVTVQSFHPGGITAEGADVLDAVHGTACAELVHDMAPDAQLFFANFDDLGSHDEAVDWMISQNVDVISYSIGWVNAGPGDGRGPVNDAVERALDAGIEWIGAAGNEAGHHWQGTFSDPDGDGFHEFAPGDDTNSIFLSAGQPLGVWLSWDDWFASDQDYDLFITDGDFNQLDASTGAQTGFQWPIEAAFITAPADGVYHVRVERFSASRDVELEMFFLAPGSMQYLVASGSLTIPADTPGSVAVGATFWGNDLVEPFSSLGPTTDGRIKPDIAAPDGVDTVSYGNLGFAFFGTSASTPHTAGAIALMKSRFGIYSLDDIVDILFGRALDRGPAGKDNQYGEGRLDVKGS